MKVFYVLCISVLVLIACSGGEDTSIVEQGFTRAEQQLSNQLKAVPEATEYPRTIGKDGKLKVTRKNDWTEGFYPGCLWYVYEYTNKEDWKKAATKWTESLEPLKKMTNHHDIGFLMYCSFGNAYRLTGNEAYKDVLVESARSLCTRFNEKTGCIKSWNYRKSWNGKDEWFYPVIIDNMMNLELLYFATKVTGDSVYAKVANRHAETTAKNQFREDYSNYHVVNYDAETGEVLNQATCQGFSDNSAWARGQAWAIYGYTMAYRETHRQDFLDMAVHTADFWLNHPNLPEDGIPYWDFNAGQEDYVPDWNYDPEIFKVVPRDASAAAIVASAFLELSGYVTDGKKYSAAAAHILKSLSSPAYLAEPGTNCNFILMHSVGSIPHGEEIDVPLIYADYYYLEALMRYKNM
ncbi:glycoside hydrolase family 88 protein [Bacteroides intestinalis]|uniref:glycoside hydrolase family 88 protein n=1 Tax=Bacteroides intestinalis TaxID=329854 RepID=UPI000E4DF692|nr:glycoside hydrolase family 88 protein [Bacteroides intestinalis]RGX84488.1 glucuronyl hydrolase [Bacteroides intestinalis]